MTHGEAQSLSRRGFVLRAAGGASALAAIAVGGRRSLLAQGVARSSSAQQSAVDSSNLFPMDQTASRPVRLPPKPGVHASLSADERDALEHRIRCQCGCTLDVFTCRTTDFSCRVSPAMHSDIMALAAGGYDAQEIVDAFVRAYGERVLMAPTKEGFNLFGWVAPFLALATGAVVVLALLRSWRSRAAAPATGPGPTKPRAVDATDDELARLEAAVRGEDDDA